MQSYKQYYWCTCLVVQQKQLNHTNNWCTCLVVQQKQLNHTNNIIGVPVWWSSIRAFCRMVSRRRGREETSLWCSCRQSSVDWTPLPPSCWRKWCENSEQYLQELKPNTMFCFDFRTISARIEVKCNVLFDFRTISAWIEVKCNVLFWFQNNICKNWSQIQCFVLISEQYLQELKSNAMICFNFRTISARIEVKCNVLFWFQNNVCKIWSQM